VAIGDHMLLLCTLFSILPRCFVGAALQQFDPHVVIQPYPNGTCVKLFETQSRVFRNLTSKPRGNTQAVLVPSAFSGEARDFYLGVVHAENKRAYQNYFYKMQVSRDDHWEEHKQQQ
jgi:hypothetical protein